MKKGVMSSMTNIFVPVVLSAVLASILLMIYAFIRHTAEKSLYLIILSVVTFLYVFGYLLEILSQSKEAAFYAVRVQYMGWPLMMPMYYLLARDVYGKKRLPLVRIALLLIIPLLSITSVQFFPLVRLYYLDVSYIYNGFIGSCHIQPGPLYLVWVVYGYMLFTITVIFLLYQMKRKPIRRRQGFLMLGAILAPQLATVVYLLFYHIMFFDPTPVSTTISLALMIFVVGYDDLLNMLPLAQTQVIENMQDALVICDNNNNFLDANRAAKTLFPELNDFLPGMSMEQVVNFKSEGDLWIELGQTKRFFSISRTIILDGTKHSGVCVVFHDITEREQLRKKLHAQALYDPLLHIYNRATFFDMANDALNKPMAQNTSYVIFMMDIDHFKRVNDIYGHPCGDVVLETVALTIKENLRKDDLVGRYGGEEIIVLLENLTDKQALFTADKLRETIEKTACNYQENTLHVTVSIGVTYSAVGASQELEEMVKQADLALYRAKSSGRNRVCI